MRIRKLNDLNFLICSCDDAIVRMQLSMLVTLPSFSVCFSDDAIVRCFDFMEKKYIFCKIEIYYAVVPPTNLIAHTLCALLKFVLQLNFATTYNNNNVTNLSCLVRVTCEFLKILLD